MKMNARRGGDPPAGKAIYDTGNLIKSIRYEHYSSNDIEGVKVGSFGVPYAAVHEFGFHGSVTVREHLRLGFKVRQHSRQMNIRARPYIRPAVTKHTDWILATLAGAITDGPN